MPPRTRSQAGKYARQRGKEAELAVAKYLRTRGWTKAERYGSTGYRTNNRISPDLGDIKNTPHLTWQVKGYLGGEPSDTSVLAWLDSAVHQAHAAGSDLGILVVRRNGHASAGEWWGYLRACDFAWLYGDGAAYTSATRLDHPVRCRLDHLVDLLQRKGYGQ